MEEKNLQELYNESLKKNAFKSDFISSMSHELRTPLNSIIGFADLLINNSSICQGTKESEYLEVINSCAKHLLGLIDKVVDISKLELGKIELCTEAVDLSALTAEVVQELSEFATKQSVSLRLNAVQQSDSWVVGDRTRIKQVISNLLTNAIKYNKPNGLVELSIVNEARDKVRVSVSDNGIGISHEKLNDVFEPFERLHIDPEQREGVGIGLTISKMLIDAMGGEIGLTSQLSEGTTFWFSLPGVNSPEATQQENVRAESSSILTTNSLKQVLYIEDNPINKLLMVEYFEEIAGVELLLAESAHEGIAIAKKNIPALILMDINLPGMSGLRALDIIKTTKTLTQIPVVAVSAQAMKHEVDSALKQGMSDYLTKPVEFEDVRKIVAKYT